MNSTLDDERTDNELPCPIPGCDYTNDSPQGIAGHVGHHDGGWDNATYRPRDAHQHATAADEEASAKVARVEHYLARNGAVSDDIRVYYHFAYGSVQIATEGYLDDDTWESLQDAIDVPGIKYGYGGIKYCTDEFVAGLDDPPADGEVCAEPDCFREDTLAAVVEGGETVVLCRTCRKNLWRLSS
jgi:hypothetical protein